MTDRVTFGSEDDVTGANRGDEKVIEDPNLSVNADGDKLSMSITVTPEQAEAVKKMLAEEKAAEQTGEKPEWLGEFESPEEMAKAYKELRTKMSSGGKAEEAAETVEADAEKKGVDLMKYTAEWNANGQLSAESYAELQTQGFTKEIVDGYISGKIAEAEKHFDTLYGAVGGREAYVDLIEWGKVNLPQHSQVAYDNLLDAGQYDAAALVLRGFVEQYKEANGTDPKTVVAGGAPDASGGGVQGFPNKSAMVAAINDPRYKSGDRAYIAEVEKRIIASRF